MRDLATHIERMTLFDRDLGDLAGCASEAEQIARLEALPPHLHEQIVAVAAARRVRLLGFDTIDALERFGRGHSSGYLVGELLANPALPAALIEPIVLQGVAAVTQSAGHDGGESTWHLLSLAARRGQLALSSGALATLLSHPRLISEYIQPPLTVLLRRLAVHPGSPRQSEILLDVERQALAGRPLHEQQHMASERLLSSPHLDQATAAGMLDRWAHAPSLARAVAHGGAVAHPVDPALRAHLLEAARSLRECQNVDLRISVLRALLRAPDAPDLDTVIAETLVDGPAVLAARLDEAGTLAAIAPRLPNAVVAQILSVASREQREQLGRSLGRRAPARSR